MEINWSQYVPLAEFLVRRGATEGGLRYELETGPESGEIIWANNSELFD